MLQLHCYKKVRDTPSFDLVRMWAEWRLFHWKHYSASREPKEGEARPFTWLARAALSRLSDSYIQGLACETREGNLTLHLVLTWPCFSVLNVTFSYSLQWSYGITCWEVFSLGRTPYPTVSNVDMLEHLSSGQRPKQPSLCPRSM